ncbi:MAG: flavodoxin domain-containing protein [Pelolinea sp.]|nr:flavodoxin domain-containing protein [Pelolinea sp.]
MKALVIYDTNYGNTKKIAKIVAGKLWKDTKLISIADLKKKDLKGVEVLIVGCPVIGWNPTDKISQFLTGLKDNELQGVKAASFDTRMKLFFFTDAAKKISKELSRAGTTIIARSQDFYVQKVEGPLRAGEKERAIVWAADIKNSAKGK